MDIIEGFAPLAARYAGFVIDLWGVLHDGVAAYPGAIDALGRLKQAGKRVVLLSNAPRRADSVRDTLRGLGISDALYDSLLTSGEATHGMLASRADPWFAALGSRVLHIGPERDRGVIDHVAVTLAATPDDADFVLNTGPDDESAPLGVNVFEPLLRACAERRLPMVCANPDLEVIRGGQRITCAGALARRYAELGGEARLIGKPDPAIYGPALALLGTSADATLAVGDSLRTDIAGAAAAGIASAWVVGGIHGEALGTDPAMIRAAARAAGLAPVACLHRFAW